MLLVMTKTAVVQLRCTDKQKAEWVRRALDQDMSLSAWIVRRLDAADHLEVVLYPQEPEKTLESPLARAAAQVRDDHFKPDFKKGAR